MILFPILASLLSIVCAFVFIYFVKQFPTGSGAQIEIWNAIKSGSRAYLKRQNSTVAVVAIVIGAVLWWWFGSEIALGFFVGAVASTLAGYLGMMTAVDTNVRTTEAAKTGLSKAFRVAFLGGSVTGFLVVGLGLQFSQLTQTAVPVAVIARRTLGPLLIVVGLLMLGLFKSRLSFGGRLSAWLQGKVGQRRGLIPAYLLGVAFAFTFCPTMFWLFFGLTIPLAVASPGGLFFPGLFAVGTALPVLGLAALLASGTANPRQFVKRFKAADIWLQRAVGVVFILIGLNEIVLYWLL